MKRDMIKTITISKSGKIIKREEEVRNAKWLRKRTAIVKQRNTRLRRDYFRLKRTCLMDSCIISQLREKYGVSTRTVYNAVNDYYR